MGMGQHPEKISIARSGAYNSNRKYVIKDTVSIPSKCYTIVRFRADNPGWWLLHCHFGETAVSHYLKFYSYLYFIEWHLSIGMGLLLQVGEPHEMLKTPKKFPMCNNFQPNIQNKRTSSHHFHNYQEPFHFYSPQTNLLY